VACIFRSRTEYERDIFMRFIFSSKGASPFYPHIALCPKHRTPLSRNRGLLRDFLPRRPDSSEDNSGNVDVHRVGHKSLRYLGVEGLGMIIIRVGGTYVR